VNERRNAETAPLGGAVPLTWNCSAVCLKRGISRPTLRKSVQRYRTIGTAGLSAESTKPKSSPATKLLEQHRGWIRDLRDRRLGSRRIQSELKGVHDLDLSRATIEKVLRGMEAKPLSRSRRPRKGSTRYARLIPGERVQMDICKIVPRVYQYTAVDRTRVRARHVPAPDLIAMTADYRPIIREGSSSQAQSLELSMTCRGCDFSGVS